MTLTELSLDNEDIRKIAMANRGRCDAYTIHKLVYSLFKKTDGGRILYHDIPSRDGSRRILVFCDRVVGTSVPVGKIRTMFFPEDFLLHENYMFSVVVNPTKLLDNKKKSTITNKEEIKNWFVSKVSDFGVSVDESSLSVGEVDFVRFSKGAGKNVIFGKVEISGLLSVSDKNLFSKLVSSGLGREKAFGCGMIRVIPVNKK